MRAKTLAAFNLFVSASLVFNQYVNPVALARMGWKYYIVYLGWLAFELVFIFFFLVESELSFLSSGPLGCSWPEADPFPFVLFVVCVTCSQEPDSGGDGRPLRRG